MSVYLIIQQEFVWQNKKIHFNVKLCREMCNFCVFVLFFLCDDAVAAVAARRPQANSPPLLCVFPTAGPQGPFYLCHNSSPGTCVTAGPACGGGPGAWLPCLLTEQLRLTGAAARRRVAPEATARRSVFLKWPIWMWEFLMFGFHRDFSEFCWTWQPHLRNYTCL